jgi:hypothetical protein
MAHADDRCIGCLINDAIAASKVILMPYENFIPSCNAFGRDVYGLDDPAISDCPHNSSVGKCDPNIATAASQRRDLHSPGSWPYELVFVRRLSLPNDPARGEQQRCSIAARAGQPAWGEEQEERQDVAPALRKRLQSPCRTAAPITICRPPPDRLYCRRLPGPANRPANYKETHDASQSSARATHGQ